MDKLTAISTTSHPLTTAQEIVWIDQLLAPTSPRYNIGSIVCFDGLVDLQLFEKAIEDVVNRHDAMRLVLDADAPDLLPRQRLCKTVPTFLEHIDLSMHADDADLRAKMLIDDIFKTPFTVFNQPLWRFIWIRISATRAYWVLCFHHLIADGISVSLIGNAVAETYRQLVEAPGIAAQGDAETPSYLDYIAHDRAYRLSSRFEKDRDFWLARFTQPPKPLFTATRPHPSDQPGGLLRWTLARSLFRDLETVATAHGCSSTHFFMALLALYFSRVTDGREEIVIGMPVHNRTRADHKRMVGMFTSQIPVATGVDAGITFASAMQGVAAEIKRCYRYQRFPISEINRHFGVGTRASTHLFDVYFSMEKFPADGDIPGVRTSVSHCDHRHTGSALSVCVADYEQARDVDICFYFDAAVLTEDVVARHRQRIERLLLRVLADPQLRVDAATLVDAAERRRVVELFNDTARAYPQQMLLHEFFEQQVQRRPQAIAVQGDDKHVSYAQLNAAANRLAHYLIGQGVGPDRRVAVCLQRSVDMVVALVAVLKAGGAYVPLDPDYPAERLRRMLGDAAPVAALVDAVGRRAIGEGLGALPCVLDMVDDAACWQACDDGNPQPTGLRPSHLAYVIYTSGSTGEPKGVMNEHRGVVNRLLWMQEAYGLRADNDAVLQKTPFGFDVSVWEFFWPLSTGARLVMARPDGHRDPDYLCRTIRQAGVTTLHFVPSMLAHFLACEAVGACAAILRRVICSGEALPAALVRTCHQRLPGVELHNLYGPTEAAIDVTAWPCTAPLVEDSIPIGRPLANTRIYVLDDDLEPVPVGVAGELFIGGVQVARGYLNRPELTAERFIRDPFSADPQARLYKTGDLGRWREDGSIDYLGRNDFQVKIRGFRIELGEIEARLAQLPGIRQAVVLARADQTGQGAPGDQRLVAYLVADTTRADCEALLAPAALRQGLAERLPEYMIPAAFVQLTELPLTANGKLDRRALPAPGGEAFAQRVYQAPVGNLETQLADFWRQLLNQESIGRDDHFFQLGGHSLLAIQLISLLRQRLGVELPLATLFERPLLSELAAAVAEAGYNPLTAIAIADRSQPLPLSWAQQRLWVIAQLDHQASAAYHIFGGMYLCGPLDENALQWAFDRVLERHEALRTRFVLHEGQPTQQIEPPCGLTLLRQNVAGADAAVVAGLVREEAEHPFDLGTGPLIRGRLLTLAPDHHLLLLTLHHLIADGWSLSILTRELSALYSAYSRGEADPLPPLPIQYADYAVWQRQWLQGPRLQEQLQYWLDHLRGAPEQINLPADRPRPAVQDYRGESLALQLDADLSNGLRALSQRHGTTLYMTLLAAWAATASRLSGQDDIVIGSPIANRTRTDLEDLIGLFVNTQALRVDLSQNPSVADLLIQVRGTALAAQHHQDIPFEQIVEAINPVRSLSHSPIFQLMFAWQNTPEAAFRLGELSLTPLESGHRSAPFDLTLDLREESDAIVGSLTYATALFERGTVERHWRTVVNMLRAMVADASVRIGAIDLLDAAERRCVLQQFNDTARPAAVGAFIHEQIEAQARARPEALAVVYGRQRLTLGALNARANQLARHLRKLGVGPDRRVLLCLWPGVDFVTALLAVHKAGGAYVPADPNYPTERLGTILHDSAPAVVITSAEIPAAAQVQIAVAAACAESSPLPILDMDVERDQWSSEATTDLGAVGLTEAHLAYVIYTSGSTGKPKAAQVQHRGLCNLLDWYVHDVGFDPDQKVLVVSSLSFDLTQKNLLAPLMVGAPLYLADDDLADGVFQPQVLVETIEREGINLLNLAPSAFHALIEADRGEPRKLRSLRRVVLGGEPIQIDKLLQLEAPRPQIINSYGPTECSDVVAWHVLDDDWAGYAERGVPLGRPVRNTRLYVLDTCGQPAPIGVAGELCIAGAGVGPGYLNQPELTAERFVADPFQPGHMLYKTGDLARWRENGELEYLGRNDFQIKIRGFRVELGEIEAQLMRLPGMRRAVVLAREDVPGDKRLVAYVVVEEGEREAFPGRAELRRSLAAALPEYMIPAAFVQLPALPLTPNGKLDRKALPQPQSEAFAQTTYEMPVGPVESILAALWVELLQCGQVGRHDNFFALGGHSLLAVTLLERMRERGMTVNVRSLFECASLKDLAEAVTMDESSASIRHLAVPENLIPTDFTDDLTDNSFEEFRL